MLPIIGTVDPRCHFYPEDVCVFCFDEVSPRAIISDKTARLLASVPQVFCSLAGGSHKHLGVMLVAKYVNVLSRTGTHLSGDRPLRGQAWHGGNNLPGAIFSPLESWSLTAALSRGRQN